MNNINMRLFLILLAGQFFVFNKAHSDVPTCIGSGSMIDKYNCLESDGYGAVLGLNIGQTAYTPSFKTLNIEDRLDLDFDTDYLMNLKTWGVSFRPQNSSGEDDITVNYNFELQLLTNGGTDNTSLGVNAPCSGYFQRSGDSVKMNVTLGQKITLLSINDIISPMSTECPMSADTSSSFTFGGSFVCTGVLQNASLENFLEGWKNNSTSNDGNLQNDVVFDFQKNPSSMMFYLSNQTQGTELSINTCEDSICVCDTSYNSCATATQSPFITVFSGKNWSRSEERKDFLNAYFLGSPSLDYNTDLSGNLDTESAQLDTLITGMLMLGGQTLFGSSSGVSYAPQNLNVSSSDISSLSSYASNYDWTPSPSIGSGKVWKSSLLLDNFNVEFASNDPLNDNNYGSLTTLNSVPPVRLKRNSYSLDLFKTWYGTNRDSTSQVVKMYLVEDAIPTVSTTTVSSIMSHNSETLSSWQSVGKAPEYCPVPAQNQEHTGDDIITCDPSTNTVHTNTQWEDFTSNTTIEVNAAKCPYNAPFSAHLGTSCTSYKGELDDSLGGGFDGATNSCIPVSPVPNNLITYRKKYFDYIYKNNGQYIYPTYSHNNVGGIPANGRLVSFHIQNVTAWDCGANGWATYGWPSIPSGWGSYPTNGTHVLDPSIATSINNACPSVTTSDKYMINALHTTNHTSTYANHYIIRYYWVYEGPLGDTCATHVTGMAKGGTGWPTHNNTGHADPCDALY